jgi:diguanylate cyclase (GGDEF)-like protein/PAS domain S-box-containing protein
LTIRQYESEEYKMNHDDRPNQRLSRIKIYILWGTVAWTVIVAASLLWNILYTKNQTLAKSDVMARLAFEKDTAFRIWVTFHGGVYVPVTAETQSNPYLNVPEKDVMLGSGKPITLMNPAYVMRQYYEKIEDKGGVKGHITSLKPLRPENKPDPWEEQSLQSFETGKKEATTIQTLGNTEYVRLMKPFVTAKGCLKCHASQGYKEGEIRGGISVSVPMAPLRILERNQIVMISGIHALFWGLGLAGIILFGKRILKSEKERAHAEQELRISEEKLAKVFQASPDWIAITTLEEGRYIDVNDAFVFMTGYNREEAIGKNAEELGLWVNPEVGSAALEMLREQGSLHNFEVEQRMKSGKIHSMLWSAEKIELKGQRYLVNAVKDITTRKEMEQEIKRIAYHDPLTGLPNRMLLIDRLTMAMSQADRNRNKVAFMMLDLDKFKEVNDTLGHHIGDLLLKLVAEKLTNILRQVDTVARFGGDEFVLVLSEQKDVQTALQIALKIMDAFRDTVVLDGHSLSITASIGISLYPDHGADIDTILKNADSAMYQAKKAGRNRYQLYNEA